MYIIFDEHSKRVYAGLSAQGTPRWSELDDDGTSVVLFTKLASATQAASALINDTPHLVIRSTLALPDWNILK